MNLNQTNIPSQPTQIGPQRQFSKNPKKMIWLFVGLVFILFGGGIIYYFYYSAQHKPEFNQVSKALVKINEIGCQNSNLFVLSTISGEAPVDKDGNYQARFSEEGAQLVFVISYQDVSCASAISLPKYQNKVFFDAKTTAQAMVFQTIGILTTNPAEAEERLKMIEESESFPDLYSYIKENLPKSDLGSLIKDPNFEALLEKCVIEIAQKLNKFPANQ